MDQQGQNGLFSTFYQGWRGKNVIAYLIAATLITFYITLYFTPFFDRPSQILGLRNKWHLYGFLYSIAMVGGGVYYLRTQGNSRYNRIRITFNLATQIVLGFSLPFVMPYFGQPEYYFSYFWPLKYDAIFPNTLRDLPLYISAYALFGSFIAAPLFAYFFGKRWYCSWFCGCGGLANTFGDPWRHLTSSSRAAHRFEIRAIYTVFVIAVIMTLLVVFDFFFGQANPFLHRLVVAGPSWQVTEHFSIYFSIKSLYGFIVGSILAGVVGTGLYPLLGPRAWCRNFCPMAAYLGLVQKLGRFHIRVKENMCISCGNCTTYCEMGIDVRAYAEKNESFTRAACVGCGACAHVCPRGVLRLENGKKSLPIVRR